MPTTIGVDIGGSHITSAGVDMMAKKIIPGTLFEGSVDNKASKELILKTWGDVINKTIDIIEIEDTLEIGIAMPGPFNYKAGMALFRGNGKYESLYGLFIATELPKYLKYSNITLRFLNDATSFAVGSTLNSRVEDGQKVIAVTLGTGFGVAFLNDNIPQMRGEFVPEGGCLWDKFFLNGIADDYFSTRWFVSKFQDLTGGMNITEVKDVLASGNEITSQIFQEFANNLSSFLYPFFKTYKADIWILGGKIAKSHHLFLPIVIEQWRKKNMEISVIVIGNTEERNILGASHLFNENFWEQMSKELPLK